MKKQELIEKLKAAGTVSSNVFIPVSDVIKMVEDLEDSASSEVSDEDIDHIVDEIVNRVEDKAEDIIDDFEIYADANRTSIEVSLSSVRFDSYQLENIIRDAVSNLKNKNKFQEADNN
jgi:light-regulated signal transduction histidine kinase (bacteriophytochrome)